MAKMRSGTAKEVGVATLEGTGVTISTASGVTDALR